MKKSIKGFYTLEAALFLPLVILAVLSFGYYMRVLGTWENCIHGALDESALIASKSCDGVVAFSVGPEVSSRINDENPALVNMKLERLKVMYSDGYTDDLTSYTLTAMMEMDLPLGFSREFTLAQKIKFRGFTGSEEASTPMGKEGLETYKPQNPVWIFPSSGEKYHDENCTYVKASVSAAVLTASLKKKYDSCALCHSNELSIGSIVFCFSGEDTAYHYASCRSIDRHTAVIDESEAKKKGYIACTKCGGR